MAGRKSEGREDKHNIGYRKNRVKGRDGRENKRNIGYSKNIVKGRDGRREKWEGGRKSERENKLN